MQLELVTIPAGWFAMGTEDGQPDERPVHDVWLDEFALAVHPVTNLEYRRFVEASGHRRPEIWSDPRFELPAQPVVAVSWFDAHAYTAWSSEVTGRCCRLPTEAEREKAARGGVDGLRYPWGDASEAKPPQDQSQLQTVGRDDPNGYGLHNMGDLVHEWCSDWYRPDYYRSSPARNPSGPGTGTRRASRGGSWRHRVPVTCCAARSSIPPDRTYADYGFRVAASARG